MSNYQQNYNQASAQQNAMQPRKPKPKFSAMIQTPAYQKSLQNSLSNPKEIQKFTAAITSVVSTNPAKDLLEETHVMNPSNSNAGGWKAMPMRTWLNDRLFTALPYLWRQLIQTVYVHSNTGQNATGNVDSPAEDKIWIPCMKDMGFNVTTAAYSDESDAPFSCFTTQASKIKKLNFGLGDASNYWLRSPNTGTSNYFYYVAAAGSSNSNYSGSSYGVAFGFCI